MMIALSARLREATATEHRAAESALRLMRPDVSLDDYRAYLASMWGIHQPFEAYLDATLILRGALPDIDSRRRRCALESDLSQLGISGDALSGLPRATDVTPWSDVAHLLGALYVLEGSTLGGAIIRRHLSATLGASVADASGYLAGYDDVGAMWKRFRAALDGYAVEHPGEASNVVEGALHTFRAIRHWLEAAPWK